MGHHHERSTGYSTSYWKGNTAATLETADRATVYTGAPSMPYPEMHFKLPDQQHEMHNLQRMLNKAFDAGIATAKKEIRDVLGVPSR